MSIDTKIRCEFPDMKKYVHLNSAAMSLMPREAVEAVRKTADDRVFTTEKRTEIRQGRSDKARNKIAKLIHAPEEDICMVTNTSEGINIVAQGLGLGEKDNIIITDKEFAGNVLAWMNLEKNGAKIKKVKTEYGKDPINDIMAAVDSDTKVVTISFVGWIDGFKQDIKKLGEFCKERNIVFVVDAIQGIGAMGIDVMSSCVSFLSCGGYKWLMSPNGTGFIYVNKELLPQLESKYISYLSVVKDPGRFDFKIELKKDVTRFCLGSINDSGIAAMEKSLDLIVNTGIQNIQRHIGELNRYATERIQDKGYKIISNLTPEHMSGILTFRGKNIKNKYEELIKRNIIVSLRNGWIRISPHLYNNQEDIDQLLDVL